MRDYLLQLKLKRLERLLADKEQTIKVLECTIDDLEKRLFVLIQEIENRKCQRVL